MDDQIVRVPEIAAITGKPIDTIRWYRARQTAGFNEGPRMFKLGRNVVAKRSDVVAWIESQYGEPRGISIDWDDEIELARQADLERGYGLLREQRIARFEAAKRAGLRTHPVAEQIALAIEAEAEHEGPRAQRIFKMCATVARRIGSADDE